MKKQKLIYVVEDSGIIRELVTRIFSNKEHFIAKSYSTGEEMFLNMNNETPNLMILDYYLNTENKNAMNGYEILKKLANENKKVTTILLSGLNDKLKINQLKQLGVVDFINKDVEDVIADIEWTSSKYLSS